jgi:PAS domain S-box-containing protein
LNIDLRTMIFVLGISSFLQVVAIFAQYRINKTYSGVGWWLLAFLALAVGLILSLLRDVIDLKLITIVLASTLTFSGPVFIYIGIMRFLGRKEQGGMIFGFYVFFLLAYLFYTFVTDDINLRSIISAVAIGFFSFLTAQKLFVHKPRAIMGSANFLSIAWLIQGVFFAFRAVILLTASPVHSYFTPTLIQASTYIFTFIISTLVVFGLIIMINQRLNTETREAKEHFELIFHTSPDAALITRLKDGVIVNVNEGFLTMTGFTRAETIGKSSLDVNIYKDPLDRQKIVADLMEKGSCENFEAIFQRKDGSSLPGVLSAKILTLYDDVPHIISITRDIGARVRAEEQIRQANVDLEQRIAERTAYLEAANKEIVSFTYAISHDLRIPVRAIASFSQILSEEYHSQLDGEGQRLLDIILQNTHKLDLLINGILSLLNVSQSQLKISPVDMTSLVRSVYLEIASPAEQASFTFNLSPLPTCAGDEGLIHLVWSNLIANAIKYSLPKEERTIAVGSKVAEGLTIYYIKDNGVGFNPKYANKLFGLFERLHKVGQFEGSGIGLAIVQRAVQRHGGKVWAESVLNQGATFYFSIPGKQKTHE